MMNKSLILVVHLEGGLVQSVSSNLPVEAEVVIIDYDTEGADEDEIFQIPQSDDPSNTADAIVGWRGSIDETDKHITKYLDEWRNNERTNK